MCVCVCVGGRIHTPTYIFLEMHKMFLERHRRNCNSDCFQGGAFGGGGKIVEEKIFIVFYFVHVIFLIYFCTCYILNYHALEINKII